MRGFAGFNFKNNILSVKQFHTLESCLTSFYDVSEASELKTADKTYLFCPKNDKLFVYGVGTQNKSNGVVWGGDNNNVMQILHYASPTDYELINNAYPYRIETGLIYCVENGEIYRFLGKNDRVITPQGNGKIHTIDDINDICVELDNDKELYYEFSIKELRRISKSGE